MIDEAAVVREWLAGVLDGNAAGVANRVYTYEIPPEIDTWPSITISDMADVPAKGVAGRRLMQDQIWQTQVTSKESGPTYDRVTPVADAIMTILDCANARQGNVVISCTLYGRPPMAPEKISNDWWVYRNLLWRVVCHERS